MSGNLGLFGFLSMVGLAITLSKVGLAAQLTLLGVFLETPTLHAQTAVFLGVCSNQVSLCVSTLSKQTQARWLCPRFVNWTIPRSFLRMFLRGQGGNRDYHVVVSDSKNLEYIMSVLKQLL